MKAKQHKRNLLKYNNNCQNNKIVVARAEGHRRSMNKIESYHVQLSPLFRLCNFIRWLLFAFLSIQLVFFLLPWVVPMPLELGPMHIQLDPEGMREGLVNELSVSQKIMGLLIGLPGLGALTFGFFRLGQTLSRFQRGQIFAIETIARLRAAAGAILLAIVLFTLEKPVRDIAFNLLGNGQSYPISIDVNSSKLLLILVCSLFYLIAGVMHEGRRLSEENEGFI
jgi:hypothetical protein